MDRKIYGIFVAGGKGTRMGAEIPKQFIELGGIPILCRTILKFVAACPKMEVITVLPEEEFDTWKTMCSEYSLDIKQKLVEGGITRFHSVKNALKNVPDGAIVMIHDGVRPLISEYKVKLMLERMQEGCRALIPVVPVIDSLKNLKKNETGELVSAGPSIDRSTVFGAQTPQMFASEDIRKAYCQGYDVAFTDDASVAAKIEIPLSFIEGERFNIKITTPEDLVLAEAILRVSCA